MRGDQYPFGDGEDWMPKSWKPPKIGDSKYLPTKMLGQIQIRTNQYEAIQQCNAKVGAVLVKIQLNHQMAFVPPSLSP